MSRTAKPLNERQAESIRRRADSLREEVAIAPVVVERLDILAADHPASLSKRSVKLLDRIRTRALEVATNGEAEAEADVLDEYATTLAAPIVAEVEEMVATEA